MSGIVVVRALGRRVGGLARRRLFAVCSRVGGWISRNAWQRGALGNSRAWLTVFCITVFAKLLRKALGNRGPVLAHSEKLAPGSAIVIRHLRPGRR